MLNKVYYNCKCCSLQYPVIGKRKLSENQGSEQEVKRVSSGEDKMGQTEAGSQSQGHSGARGQGQSQGQPVRGDGHVRTEGQQGQPQIAEPEVEKQGMKYNTTHHTLRKHKKNANTAIRMFLHSFEKIMGSHLHCQYINNITIPVPILNLHQMR